MLKFFIGCAACLALGVACAGDGLGAEIRGTVNARAGEHKPPPRYVSQGASPRQQDPEIALVAVALERLDSAIVPSVADTPLVMAQENTSFVPNLLVVPVGGQVTFPNHDAIFHNVFSYSPPHSFDLGRFPKGQTRTVRFDEHGVVRIFCEIHASMYGTILVVNSNWYRIFPAGEMFDFDGLPAGRYRLISVDASGRRSMRDLSLGSDESQTISLTLE